MDKYDKAFYGTICTFVVMILLSIVVSVTTYNNLVETGGSGTEIVTLHDGTQVECVYVRP